MLQKAYVSYIQGMGNQAHVTRQRNSEGGKKKL